MRDARSLFCSLARRDVQFVCLCLSACVCMARTRLEQDAWLHSSNRRSTSLSNTICLASCATVRNASAAATRVLAQCVTRVASVFFFVCATLAVARRRERESVWRVASEIARVAREQGRVGALRGALARDGERATLRLRIRRGRHRRLVDAGVCDCQREKSPSACVASSALFAVTVVLRSFVLYLMLSMIRTPNDPIHKREGFM